MNPLFCEVFLANLKLCKKLKKFRLYAWVLMYDHFHLLLEPNEKYNLGKIIHFIKRNTSRDINKILQSSLPEDVRRCVHLSNNFKTISPEGAPPMAGRLSEKQIIETDYFKWQKSYHDHYIRSKKDFDNHWNYIKLNPIKSEDMPNDWKYVSQNSNTEDICDTFI